MATRKEIKEAFVAEMNALLSSFDTEITTEYPNSEEQYPAVVYSYADRERPMNNNTAPSDKEVLNDGTVVETYSDTIEGVFSTEIVDSDELRKEDIYEAVRSSFEEYEWPIADESDFHADAYRITVGDSTPSSFEDRTPRGSGDAIDISVFHTRTKTKTSDPIEEIEQDADGEIRTIN
jgi:hypothetical protein